MPFIKGVEERLAGGAEFGDLLPDRVLLELYDIRSDTNAGLAIREGATRILIYIASDKAFDPTSQKFEDYMTGLVNNTSLTAAEAIEIASILRGL